MTGDSPSPGASEFPQNMGRWLATLVGQSRRRAAKADLEHALDNDYVEALFYQQHGRCAITGMHFSLMRFPDTLVKHPFAPSLHRCRATKGYVPGNVVLVCIAANFGMGEWGEEIYWCLAHATVQNERWTQQMRRRRQAQLRNAEWKAEQDDRIAVAKLIATTLAGDQLASQKRHIASLKRNLALGPSGLMQAADRAKSTRQMSRVQSVSAEPNGDAG